MTETDLDGTIMFKRILNKLSWGYEMDSSGLGSRLLEGSCVHENEILGFK
jgi:hypothetical protein